MAFLVYLQTFYDNYNYVKTSLRHYFKFYHLNSHYIMFFSYKLGPYALNTAV